MSESNSTICAFDGCNRPRRHVGLCASHYAQQHRGKPLRPLFSERRPAGSVPDPSSKKCSQCDQQAVKMRNQTYFCVPHYRMKQMRDDAKIDSKAVPSWEELTVMFSQIAATGMRCPGCKRAMNWLKEQGASTIVTLQHDRDGGLRLICLGCNSRHQHCPGDTFYQIPSSEKRCSACETVKPRSEFYKHKTNPNGLRSECKSCSKSHATAWKKEKRREDHSRQPI